MCLGCVSPVPVGASARPPILTSLRLLPQLVALKALSTIEALLDNRTGRGGKVSAAVRGAWFAQWQG